MRKESGDRGLGLEVGSRDRRVGPESRAGAGDRRLKAKKLSSSKMRRKEIFPPYGEGPVKSLKT